MFKIHFYLVVYTIGHLEDLLMLVQSISKT